MIHRYSNRHGQLQINIVYTVLFIVVIRRVFKVLFYLYKINVGLGVSNIIAILEGL